MCTGFNYLASPIHFFGPALLNSPDFQAWFSLARFPAEVLGMVAATLFANFTSAGFPLPFSKLKTFGPDHCAVN